MSNKIKSGFCQDCGEQRKVDVEVLCSGGESAFWFILGCFFFPLWGILVWRNLGSASKRCATCGSKNVINVE